MVGLVQEQFQLPRGLVGRIAGWWMARDNARMNRTAVKLLDVEPDDDVLEIGFGPGQAIELVVRHTAARSIAGVDPSDVMVDEASGRNAEWIESGRVVLVQAAVDALPFNDGQFSKVFAVSNFSLWDSPARGLNEIFRVMRSPGRLVVCLRRAARHPHVWTSPGLSPAELAASRRLIERAGFCDVRIVERRSASRIVSLIGEK